ncbi:hypothetical protein [Embleya scabrispora]|uniref:hypothetical protein n=1 Tax=Embleya scabrispora TaxID=159449 RepID=UPI0003A7FDD3|nr:hypothetical protein [Embleya scabrispora]MYS86548.1 hypothetical protein [Streptomyces sp. SID5474]
MTARASQPRGDHPPTAADADGFRQIVYRRQDDSLLGGRGLGPIASSVSRDELLSWHDDLREHVAVDVDDRGAPVTSVALVHTGRGAAVIRREYVVEGNNARVLLDPGRDLGPHRALVLTQDAVWAEEAALEDIPRGYGLAPIARDFVEAALDGNAERLRGRARDQAHLLEVTVAAVLRHPSRFFSFRQADVGIDPVPVLWGLADLLPRLVPGAFTFSTFETLAHSAKPRFVVLPRRPRDAQPWAGRYGLLVREEPKSGSDVHAHAAGLLVSRYVDTDWSGVHQLLEGMLDLRRFPHERAEERSREICTRLSRWIAAPRVSGAEIAAPGAERAPEPAPSATPAPGRAERPERNASIERAARARRVEPVQSVEPVEPVESVERAGRAGQAERAGRVEHAGRVERAPREPRVVTVAGAAEEEPAFPYAAEPARTTVSAKERVPRPTVAAEAPPEPVRANEPVRATEPVRPVEPAEPAETPDVIWYADDGAVFEEIEDAFTGPWPGFEEERGELPIPALPLTEDDPDAAPDTDPDREAGGATGSPPTPGTLPASARNAPWSSWAEYGIPDTEVDKIRRAVKRLPDKPTLRERALGGGAAKTEVAGIDNIVTLAVALRLADLRVLPVIADRLTTRLEQRRRQLAPEAWNPDDLRAMRETLLDAEQFGDRLEAAGAGDKRTRKLLEQLLVVVLAPKTDTKGVLRQIAICVLSDRRDRSPNPLIEEILLNSQWGEDFRTELGRRWAEQNPPR